MNMLIRANPLIFSSGDTKTSCTVRNRHMCFSTRLICKLQLNRYPMTECGLCRTKSKSLFLPSFGWLSTNVIIKWLTSCHCCLCNYKKLSILFQAIIYFILYQMTPICFNTSTFKTKANTIFDTIGNFYCSLLSHSQLTNRGHIYILHVWSTGVNTCVHT